MPLPAEFRELAERVSNWGRWGRGDELGTLNLITPDVVQRAAACVREGRRFSLAIPLGESGPQTGGIRGRENPTRSMIAVHQRLSRDPDERVAVVADRWVEDRGDRAAAVAHDHLAERAAGRCRHGNALVPEMCVRGEVTAHLRRE